MDDVSDVIRECLSERGTQTKGTMWACGDRTSHAQRIVSVEISRQESQTFSSNGKELIEPEWAR